MIIIEVSRTRPIEGGQSIIGTRPISANKVLTDIVWGRPDDTWRGLYFFLEKKRIFQQKVIKK